MSRILKISSILLLIAELIKTLCNTKRLQRKMIKKSKKSKRTEHNLTFTRELDTKSRYFTRIIPNICATGIVLAKDVVVVLKELNSVNTVKAVIVDNTSTNICCETGLVTDLELHTIGCSLHQSELPFRAVFLSPLMELQVLQLLLIL